MGVGELGEEVEGLFDVRGGVAERGEDEDALFVRHGFGGGVDGVKIDSLDCRAVDFYRCVVVEDDGRLEPARPLRLFVGRHVSGGFGGSPAVESRGHFLSVAGLAPHGDGGSVLLHLAGGAS